MAALVQSFPQQNSTVTMLQTRPGSSSGPFQSSGQGQQRNTQMPRNVYTGGSNAASYRGHNTAAPVAPYAFTATPSLSNANPLRQHPTAPHLRHENRTSSAPSVPLSQQTNGSMNGQSGQRQTTDAGDSSAQKSTGATQKPSSSLDLSLTDPRLQIGGGSTKPSPDRYRRNHKRAETSQAASGSQPTGGSAPPSGSGMASVGHLYANPAQTQSSSSVSQSENRPHTSKDDSGVRQGPEQAKRYRRRSISTLGGDDSTVSPQNIRMVPSQPPQPRSYASVVSSPYVVEKKEIPIRPFAPAQRPNSAHGRNGSDGSGASSRSTSRPTSKREASGIVGPTNPTLNGAPLRQEAKVVSIPPRGSSDANKRLANPSPLSRPMAASPENPVSRNTFANIVAAKPNSTEHVIPTLNAAKAPESPAAQHLAALNRKDGKKDGKPSRLRRAFSFGSAAELRKASAENSHSSNVAERARLRKDRYDNEEEAREAAIVQQQEASGLGEGIYSGQGNFFTGSTDNLSISSTASSASVMLRKMGKGVKKSTRSFVGLFRPKSVIGVPAADAALPEASLPQVSMVTVEAEREKVNVNVNPHDQSGGGTGFPKLERNSLDTASFPSLTASDKSSDGGKPRQSIVGGERERADVLNAVKKGILKRNGTDSGNSSPRQRPLDSKTPDFNLPLIPRFSDSPHSSVPTTPVDEQTPRGHRRTDSVTIEGEDYFMSGSRFGGTDSRSLPGTPHSLTARNISFSPRIQFHDTWPSGEYDRRGEIATCNRLTPTLAQAIKEELNTFKMEMEVHESSKVYTHFF